MGSDSSWRGNVTEVGTAFAGLLATVAIGSHFAIEKGADDLGRQIRNAQVATETSAAARGQESAGPNFTHRLPQAPLAAPVLEELRRAASETGVTLSSLTTDVRKPTERTLGRFQAAVVLRGGYPAVKAALAQVAARFPNLVYQRVSVRRLATPTDVEARVDVMLPMAPEHRASDSPPSN